MTEAKAKKQVKLKVSLGNWSNNSGISLGRRTHSVPQARSAYLDLNLNEAPEPVKRGLVKALDKANKVC